jgi:hypothetical protein
MPENRVHNLAAPVLVALFLPMHDSALLRHDRKVMQLDHTRIRVLASITSPLPRALLHAVRCATLGTTST